MDDLLNFDEAGARRVARAVKAVEAALPPALPQAKNRRPLAPTNRYVKITGAQSGGYYPAQVWIFDDQAGVWNALDDCYLVNPNSPTLAGIYYLSRLIDSHNGKPLYCGMRSGIIVEEDDGTPSVAECWHLSWGKGQFQLSAESNYGVGAAGVRVSAGSLNLVTNLCVKTYTFSGVTFITSPLASEHRNFTFTPAVVLGDPKCTTDPYDCCLPPASLVGPCAYNGCDQVPYRYRFRFPGITAGFCGTGSCVLLNNYYVIYWRQTGTICDWSGIYAPEPVCNPGYPYNAILFTLTPNLTGPLICGAPSHGYVLSLFFGDFTSLGGFTPLAAAYFTPTASWNCTGSNTMTFLQDWGSYYNGPGNDWCNNWPATITLTPF